MAYELELPEAWKIHPVFHTTLLRPFQVSTWTRSQESAVEELELEEDDHSYEIEMLHGVGPIGTPGYGRPEWVEFT